jgi:hypothetical protein
MSPKELLYIQDILSHEKHMQTKCTESANQIQDAELKGFVQDLATKHQQCFGQFYQLLNQQ